MSTKFTNFKIVPHLFFTQFVQGVPSSRGGGWVDLNFDCPTVSRPIMYAYADGNMAETAGQLCKPNNVRREDGSPCSRCTTH